MVGSARRAMAVTVCLCATGLCLIIAWYTSRSMPIVTGMLDSGRRRTPES
jgi:TRAP-type C4-dicarboxylate transport system permease small subunit